MKLMLGNLMALMLNKLNHITDQNLYIFFTAWLFANETLSLKNWVLLKTYAKLILKNCFGSQEYKWLIKMMNIYMWYLSTLANIDK